MVNDFLELPSDELAIYLVDFRNGETFVKRASDTEVQEMYEYGIELFFNTERYRTHCRRKPIPKSNTYAYSTVLAG